MILCPRKVRWAGISKSVVLLLLLSWQPCARCAVFVNLDFESVVQPLVIDPTLNSAPISTALPGWQLLTGSASLDYVYYNDVTLTPYAGASLYSAGNSIGTVIDGQYTITLNSGLLRVPGPLLGVSSAISQTGLVPAGSRSILLKGGGGPFSVSLNGQQIPMVPIAAQPHFTLFAGDVSPFSGSDAQLSIAVHYDGNWPLGQYHFFSVDDIQFSPNPVPEPSVFAVLALGSACLFYVSRRAQK